MTTIPRRKLALVPHVSSYAIGLWLSYANPICIPYRVAWCVLLSAERFWKKIPNNYNFCVLVRSKKKNIYDRSGRAERFWNLKERTAKRKGNLIKVVGNIFKSNVHGPCRNTRGKCKSFMVYVLFATCIWASGQSLWCPTKTFENMLKIRPLLLK